jgi:radical SAM superfamily enzyme YgiQ (UPF0313 family)
MTADVLIGQAYFLRFDRKLWAARQPYPPLGALYAAAHVRRHGYRVELFDAMLARSEGEWAIALRRVRPRFALLYEDSFNYLSKLCLLRMRRAALTMIAAARAQGVWVIVAGSDASDHPEIYLDAGADVVVCGEGEETVVEVLDVLTGKGPAGLPSVAGVSVRTVDGRVHRAAARALLRDLDQLARPAWDLVDVERYRAIWLRRHGYFSLSVSTTRGCPYHCNWCAKPIYGQHYAARSPRHVVEEILWLRQTHRPDHLWITDDIFGLKPGWIEQFGALMASRRAAMPFKCLLRADGVSEPVAAALAAAGCHTAWIGAESGSQRVLDAMEKGIRVDQIRTATSRLRERGIGVGFFLQFGYPGETLDDIEKTLAMVRDCRPDDIGISVSYPLPGTPFHDRVRSQLGEKQNWVDSDDLAVLYRATYIPEFYRALHAYVHADFRARIGPSISLPLADGPGRARGRSWRASALAGYHALRRPFLRRRVYDLARIVDERRRPVIVPLLSREAAAVPSRQVEEETSCER